MIYLKYHCQLIQQSTIELLRETFSIHLPITNLLVIADLPTPPTPITIIFKELIVCVDV
jgi:hypothetical protein